MRALRAPARAEEEEASAREERGGQEVGELDVAGVEEPAKENMDLLPLEDDIAPC